MMLSTLDPQTLQALQQAAMQGAQANQQRMQVAQQAAAQQQARSQQQNQQMMNSSVGLLGRAMSPIQSVSPNMVPVGPGNVTLSSLNGLTPAGPTAVQPAGWLGGLRNFGFGGQ